MSVGSRSIFQKLLGANLALTTVLVAALALFFSQRQLDEMTGRMIRRARGYGMVQSQQVRSAVAFHDRATAREVLGSVASLPEVVAVVLFSDDGQVLYRHGAPSRWVDDASRGVTAAKVYVLRDRIAAVSPVVSAEGPTGTLVIELSTTELAAARRRVVWRALAVGGAALALAAVVAWLIARSLARRLRAISRVAEAVAQGAVDHPPVIDGHGDEIGVLARAFNAMVRQLGDDHHSLEQRVSERTVALQTSKAALEHQIAEAARMEVELRQAQKLESVGRLAAGVAHEINTPVQFVSDSCTFLQSAVVDLQALVVAMRRLADRAELTQAVDELMVAADADYLFEQMPRAIERSLDGLDRVATIVRSLKEFAHPERMDASSADLNRAITSTLTIARHEYKYVADLVTDLGELPPVCCHLGELNQAILNIVVNAAHAIEAAVAGTERRGQITIRTRADGEHAVITIEDTGTGIPDDIRDKIFDPFFTTKEVGKGTGQGLAIVRSVVVDKHHGQVSVDSQVGVGTTFTLRLPIALPLRAVA